MCYVNSARFDPAATRFILSNYILFDRPATNLAVAGKELDILPETALIPLKWRSRPLTPSSANPGSPPGSWTALPTPAPCASNQVLTAFTALPAGAGRPFS